MSFIERFYGFTIELTAADRGIYEKIRLKIPLYPNEHERDLVARLLTFIHCYRPELEFSPTPSDHQIPTLFSRSATGEYDACIFVGLPDFKSLRLIARQSSHSFCAVYFYETEQLNRFCHLLRGSKENWLTTIKFFMITTEASQSPLTLDQSSINWQIVEIDNIFYLEGEENRQQIEFEPINIWNAYQESLKEPTPL